MEYTSPNLGGFKGAAVYGSGEVPGQPGIANMGLHGSYTQGPFTAALSAQRVRVNTPSSAVSQQDAYLGGVTYDFKLFKKNIHIIGKRRVRAQVSLLKRTMQVCQFR
ncbi:porin [Undibacterium arcticum]